MKMASIGNAILRSSSLPRSGPYPTPDPFLFCVYHSDDYPADESGGKMETTFRGNGSDFDPYAPYRMYHGDLVPGFPQHPHRGFETITATTVGLIDHADSKGNAGRYGEGDVQWMTAGKGIVHSEMFPLVHADKPNPLRFFQIWLNLPAKSKMVSPSFAMFWAENIHTWRSEDGLASATVWSGDYFVSDEDREKGKQLNVPPPDSWAANPDNDVAIIHIKIEPGGTLTIPKANQAGVDRSMYLTEGHFNKITVDGQAIDKNVRLEMDATKEVPIEVNESSVTKNSDRTTTEFLLLQGKPINEPVAKHGPFVMNKQSEIREAFMDYSRTQFGGWPWERDDLVFAQDKGRFALFDGVEIRPPGFVDGEKKEDEL
eukprot:CAMPEP_0183717920 /NCGR_PEP_ID=MMETSP0737-20130205/11344_1 /TAXON_ID=385413 /ORGANISM="Thalassiosira miniscula, Strain CCMP1093" /LENGTH=371 /DNA_ID=CAMNT_0025947397 /DNA_START=17 /DNA_END=1132 /DNA_ORIENTATION=+